MFNQLFRGGVRSVNRGCTEAFGEWMQPSDPLFLIDQSPLSVDPLLALVRLWSWACQLDEAGGCR